METKSLSEIARGAGVSPSYLSQVVHEKRRPSKRLLRDPSTATLPRLLDVRTSGSSQRSIRYRAGLLPDSQSRHQLSGRKLIDKSQSAARLIDGFIASRREGLSTSTIKNYRLFLTRSAEVVGTDVTWNTIQEFIATRPCSGAGKHAYYRCLRAFYNWLYSRRSGCGLVSSDNPILDVPAPLVEKKILPSLTTEQLEIVIDHADCVRDRAIVSLFADSGLRLRELASIDPANIDWKRRLIRAHCKGNKDGLAPFGQRTETLLKQWLTEYTPVNGRLWGINANGIEMMLKRLKKSTGLPCNAHTFRRTFATILSKRGVDSLHIMRLGRWSSIQMVERYTRSVKFDDSLKFYSAIA